MVLLKRYDRACSNSCNGAFPKKTCVIGESVCTSSFHIPSLCHFLVKSRGQDSLKVLRCILAAKSSAIHSRDVKALAIAMP